MSHDHGNILPSYLKVFFTLMALTLLTVAAAKLVHFPDVAFIPGYVLNITVGLVTTVSVMTAIQAPSRQR